MNRYATILSVFLLACVGACSGTRVTDYDVLIRGGMIYDGSGGDAYTGDIGIKGDRIVAVGQVRGMATEVIDARGRAVAPGFINMLSWATESLIQDGRSQSDIRQGVTLVVMGEGWSMGPLNPAMQDELKRRQSDIRYEVTWDSFGGYFDYLESRGIATNVASFVGATNMRIHEIGFENRAATPEELTRMRALTRQAMTEGALGIGASLIYAPAFFADTEELIALCEVAAEFGGRYIAHVRNEGNGLVQAVDELIRIAEDANIGAEIYHLKASGAANYGKLDTVIDRVNAARARGLDVSANMYTYTAGATGLDAAMPPWVQEGGYSAWSERLRDPEIRKRLREEMTTPTDDWDNLYLAAGSADRLLLTGFKNPDLKPLTGKTLAEVAELRGTSPLDTIMDLVIEDGSRVGTVYFLMSEDNIKKKIALPWMSFGSDGQSLAPEGPFLLSNPHPRAYGNFARLLGKYVREEQVVPLEEAVRRLTSFPADNLKIKARGRLRPGFFADVVVFDPATITDRATFAEPHQYATGVDHVLVNGVSVLRDGEHTGAMPGRFVPGPGYRE